jgi:arylsulfatase A-like enzyme
MLRAADRFDDALVVVLSDHGEAFLEHGRFMHTWGLYEEYLRVPLVVKWPQGKESFASEVSEHVTLIDLAPTILDALGIEDSRARFQGRSLLPLVFGDPPGERMIFAYTHGTSTPVARPRQKWAARFDDMKLVFEPWPRGPADDMTGPANVQVFDLGSDPNERTDLEGEGGVLEEFLMQELRLLRYRNAALFNSVAEGQLTEAIDPDVLRELRALGYIQ